MSRESSYLISMLRRARPFKRDVRKLPLFKGKSRLLISSLNFARTNVRGLAFRGIGRGSIADRSSVMGARGSSFLLSLFPLPPLTDVSATRLARPFLYRTTKYLLYLLYSLGGNA
jgi:hypothetical protein